MSVASIYGSISTRSRAGISPPACAEIASRNICRCSAYCRIAPALWDVRPDRLRRPRRARGATYHRCERANPLLLPGRPSTSLAASQPDARLPSRFKDPYGGKRRARDLISRNRMAAGISNRDTRRCTPGPIARVCPLEKERGAVKLRTGLAGIVDRFYPYRGNYIPLSCPRFK